MAKRTKHLVGLDIDPAGITAAEVSANGSLRVERSAVAPLATGIVRDGEVTDVEGLAAALRELFREHKRLGKRVRVGVANQKVVVRMIELPVLTDPKELEAAVRFQAQDQLPMPLDSAVLDYVPLEIAATDDGPRQRVLLVAARRDMIERLLAAVRGAGLRADGVDLSAFAMIRALSAGADPDETVLYLSVSGLTSLAVARGRTCIYTRASGGGFEALAGELAERCELTHDDARSRLARVGLDAPLEQIEGEAQVVDEARRVLTDGVRRIAAEVRNTLDFQQMQGGVARVSRVVLAGTAAGVPGFAAALGAELALPVHVGSVDGAPEGPRAGGVTVAAGLAVAEAPA